MFRVMVGDTFPTAGGGLGLVREILPEKFTVKMGEESRGIEFWRLCSYSGRLQDQKTWRSCRCTRCHRRPRRRRSASARTTTARRRKGRRRLRRRRLRGRRDNGDGRREARNTVPIGVV